MGEPQWMREQSIPGKVALVARRSVEIARHRSDPFVDARRQLLYANLVVPVLKLIRRNADFSVEMRNRVGTRRMPVRFAGSDLTIDRATLYEVFLDTPYGAKYEDAVVVDIGAHKGYFGAFALLHGARAVTSYEPERRNFEYLRRLVDEAELGEAQWNAHHAAVGTRVGTAELHVSGEAWAHSLTDLPSRGRFRQVASQTVQLVPLADVLSAAAQARGRIVVKIDAEGAEETMVPSAEPELWRPVDEAFIEVHDFTGRVAERLVDHLQRAGLEAVPRESHQQVLHLRRP